MKDCVFTGHKTYHTIGSAGTSVGMGTYEINGNLTVNLSFIGCTQTNDILDSTYWGVLGSNYCKNMLYEDCVLSRFDAHMGVANATIRRCTLGHQRLNAIGFGTLTVEESTICSTNFITLRTDYGSTWHGNVIIRNCEFLPKGGAVFSSASIFGGSNDGTHDFGYTCYLPTTVTIDGFTVRDSAASNGYGGLTVFANINANYTTENYTAAYPIVLPESINVSGFRSVKGKPLTISANSDMCGGVTLNVTE